MSDFVKRLREQRANIWEQAKALLDTAAAEDRDLSAEEQSTYDKLNGDLDAIAERVGAIEEQERRNAEMDEAFRNLEGGRRVADAGTDGGVGEQLRAFLRGESRGMEVGPQGKVSFRDLLKSGSGGNAVPTSFYNQLVQHMIENSGVMLAGPTVLNTASGESIDVPITTAHGTGALTAEGAAIAESDPTFSKRTLGAYKYATLVQISTELVSDAGFDIESYIAEQAGRGVGNALGEHLVTGSGTSQPAGIVTGSSLGVTTATGVAGVPSADNLIDLYFSVISPYRGKSAAWLMNDSTVAKIRKIKDTTNQYLWQPGLVTGAPDTILGKPLYTDPNVAATAVNAKSVVFGDISRYFVRLAGGVRFERSDEFAFNSDLVTFRCLVRGDGVLVDQTGAVKHIVGAAT